ncbi:MAG: sulfatase, partial [Verrucomicrobiae bacterium]|nr:sulfatase [Verrucomicrobiae bacterium]
MRAPLILLTFLGLATCLATAAENSAPGHRRPNVLFIAVDDLKPMLGCYGDKTIRTPNIDRLAASGTVFLNAYCQQAVCGPTRASLLTGLRPDTTRVYDLKTRIRDILPDVVTLPQHFKNNGYQTVGMGKVFDPRTVNGQVKDDPVSWSRPYIQFDKHPDNALGFMEPGFVARAKAIQEAQGGKGDGWDSVRKELGGMPATEGEDVPDDAYDDGNIAKAALAVLPELAAADDPFFLAVGFKKPHLPFVAPQKYWDLYRREDMSLAEFTTLPQGAPEIAFQDSWELKNGTYTGIPSGPGLLPEDLQRELIHGYMACVSYTDAQVGKLLDALADQGVADTTIVVLWGDHGWHLGDHGMWCKHTNYEQATHAPLIIAKSASGGTGDGAKCASPVEFVDIYPTLCDLAGLPKPAALEGASLVPILDDPSAKVRDTAMSQYPRGGEQDLTMGYTWCDARYRYVEWV